jgi:hypothetical protein
MHECGALRGFFGVDDGVRPGFTAIRVEVTVTAPETEERYAELAAAVDAHCPVLDLFQNPVPVSRALHLADPAATRRNALTAPGPLPHAVETGIHGVRTRWIRGFMTFSLARS